MYGDNKIYIYKIITKKNKQTNKQIKSKIFTRILIQIEYERQNKIKTIYIEMTNKIKPNHTLINK